MNVKTNELYDIEKMSKEELENLFKNPDVLPVPNRLQKQAMQELNGNKEAVVANNSPLAKWAKRVRQNQQNKYALTFTKDGVNNKH